MSVQSLGNIIRNANVKPFKGVLVRWCFINDSHIAGVMEDGSCVITSSVKKVYGCELPVENMPEDCWDIVVQAETANSIYQLGVFDPCILSFIK